MHLHVNNSVTCSCHCPINSRHKHQTPLNAMSMLTRTKKPKHVRWWIPQSPNVSSEHIEETMSEQLDRNSEPASPLQVESLSQASTSVFSTWIPYPKKGSHGVGAVESL